MKTLEELKATVGLRIVNTAADGGCGEIWQGGKPFATVIWSDGGGWEHVSVAPYKRSHTPTWDEMCRLKEMFFRDDEVVVQYHPTKREYVNNLPNCLHLWRPLNEEMPTPPAIMVGVKKGQSAAEVIKAIQEVGVKQSESFSRPHENDGEWISVEERLPEEGGMYLVYNPSRAVSKVVTARYSKSTNRWCSADACCYHEGITHWMTLPEPPKKGGE